MYESDRSLQSCFPIDDNKLVPIRRYSWSSREVVRYRSEILMFLGSQIFWGGTPNFWSKFINYSHHRTCG